ncbi:hypothetical protein J1N35_014911 [Gossypium stocksii]|uniref:Uncharacterized protein n=1 Tax=Gossypium stocksii TaxID=47602 RepID=A0A9D3VUZ1_9ROSI|nr:hypothetical protein J1N35_014911 [Gossypium stocksii]
MISEPVALCYNLPGVSPGDVESKFTALRWSTNSGVKRSYTIPIYRQMIETHAGEGRPHMDPSFDLKPSLEYIEQYFKIKKLYLFGGQSMVVPPYIPRLGQPSHPFPHPPLAPEPKSKPSLEPELEPSHSPELMPKFRGIL